MPFPKDDQRDKPWLMRTYAGHSSPVEGLMLVREARKQGVEHVVVTHALTPPVRMSIAQMKEAGAEIIKIDDKKAFQDLVKPVWDKYGAQHAALIKRIQDVN